MSVLPWQMMMILLLDLLLRFPVKPKPMIGVYFMGMFLMGVYLTGVHLMGVYLILVHLPGVHLIGV
jgi:hypothetical protein